MINELINVIVCWVWYSVADESEREVQDTTNQPESTHHKAHDRTKSDNNIDDESPPSSGDESNLMEHSSGTLSTVKTENPNATINSVIYCCYHFFCWYVYRWKVRGQFQKLPLGTAGEIVQTEVLFGVVLRFMFQVENVRWRNGNTFQLCQPPNKMNIFLNFQDSAHK